MRHQDVRLEEVYAYRQDKHANVVRVLARRAGVPLVRNDRADVRGHRRHVKNGVEVEVLEDVRVHWKDFVAGERLVVEARFLTPWSEHEEQESAERRRRLAQEQATVACERARRLLAEIRGEHSHQPLLHRSAYRGGDHQAAQPGAAASGAGPGGQDMSIIVEATRDVLHARARLRERQQRDHLYSTAEEVRLDRAIEELKRAVLLASYGGKRRAAPDPDGLVRPLGVAGADVTPSPLGVREGK